MAKVPFSKLQAKVNNQTTTVVCYNLANEEVCYEVRQYLSFAEKLDLVSKIINQSIDDNGFYNPMRVKFNMVLEVVYAYTNLSFTDKMKEDPFKLYDIFISTGIFDKVIEVIENDWDEIQKSVWSSIDNIYKYRNSVMGILENVVADYNNLNLDATEIQAKLADPENMALLKDVLAKLG